MAADTTEASPFSTFQDTLYEDDDGCRTYGADDVEVCSCRELFRKLRIQMIDDRLVILRSVRSVIALKDG